MQRVRKYYVVILTLLMVTVLAPVEITAADLESAESESLEWEKKSGGVVSSQKPNKEKWLRVYSSTDSEDPETAPSYLEQPSPKLDTYYYYADATGKPLINYKTEDGWFDATEYIRECIQWELNNYYEDYTGTPAEGLNPKVYTGTRITKNHFTETYGYEPGKDDIINFYDVVPANTECCCPWVPIMAEGTSLGVDDFYYTVTGLTYVEDDPETLNVWKKLGANVIKIQDDYFIGANAPAWKSAELTGDTTIHRGTNWLTYTGTTKWGDTYTVTFPVVGQPKPIAVNQDNVEAEEDKIDLVPVPDTRKVPIAVLGVPLGGALVAFFWATHRKIKFHGIFDTKNDNIIIKGKAVEEKKNDWFIPSINERLVNQDFNVDKYIDAVKNCGVLSLFPMDTEIIINADLYSGEIYSVRTKASEKLLFRTLEELENRVVGPVEVVLASPNKHINIKMNYFI